MEAGKESVSKGGLKHDIISIKRLLNMAPQQLNCHKWNVCSLTQLNKGLSMEIKKHTPEERGRVKLIIYFALELNI